MYIDSISTSAVLANVTDGAGARQLPWMVLEWWSLTDIEVGAPATQRQFSTQLSTFDLRGTILNPDRHAIWISHFILGGPAALRGDSLLSVGSFGALDSVAIAVANRPFTWAAHFVFPYVAGLARHGNTQIYVSRGTGYVGPPVRIGAPAELTILELVRAGETS